MTTTKFNETFVVYHPPIGWCLA